MPAASQSSFVLLVNNQNILAHLQYIARCMLYHQLLFLFPLVVALSPIMMYAGLPARIELDSICTILTCRVSTICFLTCEESHFY
jgi:hypothetical protein